MLFYSQTTVIFSVIAQCLLWVNAGVTKSRELKTFSLIFMITNYGFFIYIRWNLAAIYDEIVIVTSHKKKKNSSHFLKFANQFELYGASHLYCF